MMTAIYEFSVNKEYKNFLFLIKSVLFLLVLIKPVYAETGLPWSSSFETGDFSEWNASQRGEINLVEGSAIDGNWAARINLSAGTLNNNYQDHIFGDHVNARLEKVEELYLQFYSKFESGYSWPQAQSHKLAIINLTNGVDTQRRYQVYVWVTPSGFYNIDYTDIEDWQFYGLDQNVGIPSPVRFDIWDKVKVYIKQNSPGVNDGIIKMWVNDELKLDHSGLNLRENTNFGMNKLILSSYTSDLSGGDGVQWSDAWLLSEVDPGGLIQPKPPTLLTLD